MPKAHVLRGTCSATDEVPVGDRTHRGEVAGYRYRRRTSQPEKRSGLNCRARPALSGQELAPLVPLELSAQSRPVLLCHQLVVELPAIAPPHEAGAPLLLADRVLVDLVAARQRHGVDDAHVARSPLRTQVRLGPQE